MEERNRPLPPARLRSLKGSHYFVGKRQNEICDVGDEINEKREYVSWSASKYSLTKIGLGYTVNLKKYTFSKFRLRYIKENMI